MLVRFKNGKIRLAASAQQSNNMDFLSSPLVIGILLGVVGIIVYLFLGNSNPQVDIPKVQEKPKKTKPVGPFTEEQVAAHNKPDDYWIIINGKVYDVSEFYVEHPVRFLVLFYLLLVGR